VSPPLKVYRQTGHRASLLNIARFCSKGPELSEQHGAGRAAAVSKAFHAKCANQRGWREQWNLLTPEEREQASALHVPGTIVIMEGDDRIELDYDSSEKEVLIGLTENGCYADPDKQDVLIRGTLDFAWVREVRGLKVAYVADIKLNEWTTSGPDSLQVMAYGFAFAEMRGCDAFVPAIWAATQGTWEWGEWIDLSSPEAADIWATVKAAAQNKDGGFVTGQHCRGCYARLHCPEHVLPVNGPLAELATGDLTNGGALKALLAVQAAEEVIKKAKDSLQEAVRRGLVIQDPQTKKVWKPSKCRGRESVDTEALKAELGEGARRFFRRGADFERFMWVKG
jgi:hypothetical protein